MLMTRLLMQPGVVLVSLAVGCGGECHDPGTDAGPCIYDAAIDGGFDGGSDAGPPVPDPITAVDVPCDIERVQIGEGACGSEPCDIRWTHWYAELVDERIAPESTRLVVALGCDFESLRTLPQCEPDGTIICTGDPPLESLECHTMEVQLGDGVARVRCGSLEERRQAPDPSWSPTSGDAERATHVRFSIDFRAP